MPPSLEQTLFLGNGTEGVDLVLWDRFCPVLGNLTSLPLALAVFIRSWQAQVEPFGLRSFDHYDAVPKAL